VCGSTDATAWKPRNLPRPLAPEDLKITDHRYGLTLSLARCRSCGFIFSRDDDVRDLPALYGDLVDDEYESSQDARRLQMGWLLERARRLSPDARSVLDVGAGAGILVALARAQGLDAIGIEPSGSLVDAAARLHRVELLHGVLPHPALAGRRFDLVFLVDVLEHVADPVELLTRCRDALAPAGVLVVVTPDAGSIAARVLRRRWWHFRPAHVGYFDAASLATACRRAGLATVRRGRATWFFRASYLHARLGAYLPRWALRLTPPHVLERRIIPLNLFDSFAVFLRREAASRA
jgi:SAM-dependent methyltransferase